jgi:hypothetical protein
MSNSANLRKICTIYGALVWYAAVIIYFGVGNL